MINTAIRQLLNYGLSKELFTKRDEIYVTNMLLDALDLDSFTEPTNVEEIELEEILKKLNDYATEKGIIEDSITYRDLFDTKLMGLMLPRPSEITDRFFKLYNESPEKATDWYYKFSCDTDYIRRYRIVKDMKWVSPSPYGDIDITVNLSKPEKDPKAIAAARNAAPVGDTVYPKCQLCIENEGYRGRINHPARENHRIIPITINNSDWCFQYSPYVYYNEHCIVFNSLHTPMAINHDTFVKLFDFVKLFPHYFVGSNADLPIVGGSILTHDHFQGGHYTFAMAKAPVEYPVSFENFSDINAGIVKWPMSVIRLSGKDTDRIIALADKILVSWRGYTDADAYVFAETDGVPHNTITPIARKNGENFELDLVLRNNITTEEHPAGLYHPHAEHHHIKRENIGLIEVMGLAVLPARLKNELAGVSEALVNNIDFKDDPVLNIHYDWAMGIKEKYADINADNVDKIIKDEVGLVFSEVLEHAGVYKRNEQGIAAFKRFIESVK